MSKQTVRQKSPINVSETPCGDSVQRMAMRQRVDDMIARTHHVAAAREREYARQAAQDANCKESTVEGMAAALKILLEAYPKTEPHSVRLSNGGKA